MGKKSIAVTLLLGIGLGLTTFANMVGRPYAAAAHSYAPIQTTPTLSINDVSLAEGNAGTTNMIFTVTLTASGARPTIGVAYDTANGPPPSGATAPADYTSISNNLIFPSGTGTTTMTVSVPINGDTSVEADETFFVNLSRADGANITDGQGVGTILNDDGAAPLPTLSIDDVSVLEGNSEHVDAVFTVSVSGARSTFITFAYATADGTATSAGSAGTADYSGTAVGGVRIDASVNQATIRISVSGDTTIENDETFSVILMDVTEATVARGTGVCTIVNDDFCMYSISPASQTIEPAGGTGTISVVTQPGCTWTATSNAGFITITSGASGTGNGTVNYSVAANMGESRSGTMIVAGRTFTVVQGKVGCSYTISPSAQTFPPVGGDGSVTVDALTGCPWTASANVPWINIRSGSSGTGNGSVRYAVAPTIDADRTGTISIAGRAFTVRQVATGRCRARIEPLSRNFAASGGSGEIRVLQTDPLFQGSDRCNCIRARSNVDWIAIPQQPNKCDYSLGYQVAPNDGLDPRTAAIEFGSTGPVSEDGSVPEFVVEQRFLISQRGTSNLLPCVESISPTYRVISSGGLRSFEGYMVSVTAPPDCTWEPFSARPWVHILTVSSDLSSEEGSGRGNGSFNYDVFGSEFGDVPSGHPVSMIAVGGKEHTIYLEDWVSNCLISLFCKYLPSSCPQGTLTEARDFRDQVLAKTPRGQRYTQLYYKFSTEAAGLVMLNPMLVLRSREMMERYMPIIKSMAGGDQVTLTMSDLNDIEGFLNSFAQKGTPEFRQVIKALCEDLRDPQVHAEFNITIIDGPMRDLPPRDEVQTVKQTGMMLAPIGLLLFCRYAVRRRRNNERRR